MKRFQSAGLVIEIRKGDIVKQSDIDAVVNAANAELRIGGGVAGAIHRAAGSELEKACRSLAPISPGEAVITEGYDLENKYIIHTLGPVYGLDEPEAELLAECYKNSLRLADENKLESIVFPAISTGAFAYPMQEAADVSLKAVKNESVKLKNVKMIRFVLLNERDYRIYLDSADEIFAE